MPREQKFSMTDQHVALLRRAYVGWDGGEFGAPAIDCKRPYGNSDASNDLMEILYPGGEWVEDRDAFYWQGKRFDTSLLHKIHDETKTALQIVLATGSFEPGVYATEEYSSRGWRRISVNPPTGNQP